MLHSTQAKEPQAADQPAGTLANPRRTRLGADGQPEDAPHDTGRD